MTNASETHVGKYADVPVRVRSWGIILAVLGIALLHPLLTALFGCFLAVWSAKEYFAMLHISSKLLWFLAPLVCLQFALLYTNNPELFVWLMPLCCVSLALIITLLTKKLHLFFSVIIALLIGFFAMSHLVFIRLIDYPADKWTGIKLLMFLLLLTEFNDIFQYLTGKPFGRHPIAPHISPHKTVEGFVGGIVLTQILSNIIGRWLLPDIEVFTYCFIALIISILGFMGDLFISIVKRKAGVKDTGTLIPGHGGLLDRVDSLIFLAPLYYLWIILWMR